MQPYIEIATALSDYCINDEEIEEFHILSVGRNGLPALAGPRNVSVILKYDVLCLSVFV